LRVRVVSPIEVVPNHPSRAEDEGEHGADPVEPGDVLDDEVGDLQGHQTKQCDDGELVHGRASFMF
jgi:hypothetical protein